MTEKKKVFLVDAMALIYRSHFAFIRNPIINSKGMNTSAIYGFLNTLLDVLDKEKPDYMAIAFDSYEPTLRTEGFTEYKANRDKQPEDISISIPVIKKILDALHIPVLEKPGYEADDIVATLSKKIPAEDYWVYMLTPDKDYAQLVSDNVFMLKPARMGNPPELWDVERVKTEFGIKRIDQVIEIQGLMGDAADNIPGVPGIGPKTAKKLIADFDNIENLLQNTGKLKGKVKESLEQYAEQALVSRQLAKLITDMDVEFSESEFALKEWDKTSLEALFADLEFRNLGKRMLGHIPQQEKSENENDNAQDDTDDKTGITFSVDSLNFETISGIAQLESVLINASGTKEFSFSFEFNSENSQVAKPLSIAFSFEKDKIYEWHFGSDIPAEISVFSPVFSDKNMLKICFDLKFILNVFARFGLETIINVFDIKIAHYLLEPEDRQETDYLAQKYLNYSFQPQELFQAAGAGNPLLISCAVLHELHKDFYVKLNELGLDNLFNNVEIPLSYVLAQMEQSGVKLDKAVLATYSKELLADLQKLEEEILAISGVSFNLNSPQQLGHVLFDILKLDPDAKKTKKSKQYSTNEEVLTKLASKHKIASLVLDYREIQKLKSTYVDALPHLVNPVTHKLHTTYDQTGTATGRLSSKNPNLQNIPIRTERGRYIRRAFIPESEDKVLISADYSQIELRIIAHTSDDQAMIDDFVKGYDIHRATAARVFGVSLEEVTPDMRRKAKEVNFGIIYGISSWGLSQRLGISRAEGSEIKKQYFEKYPGIKNYMDSCITLAKEKGFAETLLNRRRYLRDINSRSAMQRSFAERNAINAPIQGSAADLIKIAMVKISNEFREKEIRSEMILQVHDELVFDTFMDEKENVKNIIKDNMENAMQLKVPLLVEIGEGKNWIEAH